MPDINVSLVGDSVVEAIKGSVNTEIIEVDGQIFTTRQVFPPPSPRNPDVITVHTLSGIVDYVNNLPKIDPDLVSRIKFAHVVSHDRVDLCGALHGRNNDRYAYVQAVYSPPKNQLGFQLGQFCDPETFTIALQSLFDPSGDAPKVLQLVGNMRCEAIRTSEDDGVTQVVGMRAGVVLKSQASVPNPVTLAPYRTFGEIEQPQSPFILRVRENGDKPPLCALFSADGDAWKLDAIQSIKEYLAERITTIQIIA